MPAGPSRSAPYESVITEFPFFTFLYADLHAHLIAMPLTFLSLAVALAVVKGRRARCVSDQAGDGLLGRWCLLLLWALTIGAMRTTNTWDVPPHLLVVLGALVIARVARGAGPAGLAAGPSCSGLAIRAGVPVLSWSVLYQPFWANYGSFYDSLARVDRDAHAALGLPGRPWPVPVCHRQLPAGAEVARRGSERSAAAPPAPDPPLPAPGGARLRRCGPHRRRRGPAGEQPGSGVGRWSCLILLEHLSSWCPGLVVPSPGPTPDCRCDARGAYAYRGLSVFALGLPVGLLGLLLLFRPGLSPTERLWAYLVLLGLAMTLGVEVIVIEGDIGRMNTVFKFYLQVWLMWGVAAAAALAWLVPRVRRWRLGRGLWLGILAVLLFFAALYPPLATSAKIRDRFDPDLRAGPGRLGLHGDGALL